MIQGQCNNHSGTESRVYSQPLLSPCIEISIIARVDLDACSSDLSPEGWPVVLGPAPSSVVRLHRLDVELGLAPRVDPVGVGLKEGPSMYDVCTTKVKIF